MATAAIASSYLTAEDFSYDPADWGLPWQAFKPVAVPRAILDEITEAALAGRALPPELGHALVQLMDTTDGDPDLELDGTEADEDAMHLRVPDYGINQDPASSASPRESRTAHFVVSRERR